MEPVNDCIVLAEAAVSGAQVVHSELLDASEQIHAGQSCGTMKVTLPRNQGGYDSKPGLKHHGSCSPSQTRTSEDAVPFFNLGDLG